MGVPADGRRRSRTASALLLAGAAAALAAPPLLLARVVGWPLPSWPIDLGAAVEAVQIGLVPSSVWVNVLAIMAWVAWAVLVGMLMVEIVAVAANRTSSRVAPAFIRHVAQVLVSAALTLSGPTQTAVSGAASVAPAVAVAVDEPPAAAGPATDPGLHEAAPDGTRLVTVVDGDSWAGFAETVLGDASAGGQLRDLNTGRQVDGQPVTSNTAFVEPGWTLLVPTASPIDPTPVTAHPAAVGHEPILHAPESSATAAVDDAGDVGTWTVEQGDHMWRIAEETLEQAWDREAADDEIAPYWQSVVETNHDNLLPPEDPDLIYPGQQLDVPEVPADPHAAPVNAQDAPGAAAPGAAGAGSADIDPSGQAPPGTADLAQPTDAATAGNAVAEITPDQRNPAQSGRAGVAATAPASEPSVLVPTRPGAPPTSQAADTTADTDRDDADGGVGVVVPALAGGGVMAAGVVAMLRRRRRRRLQERRPGQAPAPTVDTDIERQLHAAAELDLVELMDLVLRDLVARLDPDDPPAVTGVCATDTTINVLLARPHTGCPTGWRLVSDIEWICDLDQVDVDELAHASHFPGPLPALVSIGTTSAGATLLVDLEHATATRLSGSHDDVAATMATMALELAGSPFADDLEVACIGFGRQLGDDLARIRHIDVDRLDDFITDLDTAHDPDTVVLADRIRGLADRVTPLVVLDPTGHPALVTAAHATPHAGVTLVTTHPDCDATWQLTLAGNTVRVTQPTATTLDTMARPTLAADTLADIAALLAHARNGHDVDHPDLAGAVRTIIPGDDPAELDIPTRAPVQVRLLGPVRIDGLVQTPTRSQAGELIAYLALHRRGVAADTLMEILWPGHPPNQSRLHKVVSDARAALGTDTAGNPRLPRIAADGLYTVTDDVGTDIDTFDTLVDLATQTRPTRARTVLRRALELVDGQPFTGGGTGYGWADTSGQTTATTLAVDEAARTLGELYLDAADPTGADWAARRGLASNPGSAGLYAIRMRAAAGDATRLELLLREATAVLTADDGPEADTTIPAELLQLYDRLQPNRTAI